LLLIIGDDAEPRYRNELEDRIIKSGLSGHVRMVGHTPYMPEVYTMGLFTVVPSTEPEAFGRVPIESHPWASWWSPLTMAAGETVIPGVTGWLVEPGKRRSDDQSIGGSPHPPRRRTRRPRSHRCGTCPH